MRKNLLAPSLAFAAMLAFGFSAVAQHGGGRPAGAGPGSMGTPSGAGFGNGGRPADIAARAPWAIPV